MKKCPKCDVSLFDRATECGICGITDLKSMVKPEPVVKETPLDKQLEDSMQDEYEIMLDPKDESNWGDNEPIIDPTAGVFSPPKPSTPLTSMTLDVNKFRNYDTILIVGRPKTTAQRDVAKILKKRLPDRYVIDLGFGDRIGLTNLNKMPRHGKSIIQCVTNYRSLMSRVKNLVDLVLLLGIYKSDVPELKKEFGLSDKIIKEFMFHKQLSNMAKNGYIPYLALAHDNMYVGKVNLEK